MRSSRLHGLLPDGHLLGPEAWIEPACHGLNGTVVSAKARQRSVNTRDLIQLSLGPVSDSVLLDNPEQ